MLTELHIENLGVIERLDLSLGPGHDRRHGRDRRGQDDAGRGPRAARRRARRRHARAPRRRRGARRRALRRRRRRARADAGGARRRSIAGLPRRTAGHGRRARRGRRGTRRPARPARAPEPARRARPSVRALDAFGRVDVGAAAGRARPPDRARRRARRARWRRPASGPARSTCCGSRSPSSTAPRWTIRRRKRPWRSARTCSPTPPDTARPAPPATPRSTDDGGARDALAAALSAVTGRAPFAIVADRLAAVLAELDDVAAELRDSAEAIDEDPEQLADVRAAPSAAARPLPEVRRRRRRGPALPRRGGGSPRRARGPRRAGRRDRQRADGRRRPWSDAAATAVGAARRAAGPDLGTAVTARLRELRHAARRDHGRARRPGIRLGRRRRRATSSSSWPPTRGPRHCR